MYCMRGSCRKNFNILCSDCLALHNVTSTLWPFLLPIVKYNSHNIKNITENKSSIVLLVHHQRQNFYCIVIAYMIGICWFKLLVRTKYCSLDMYINKLHHKNDCLPIVEFTISCKHWWLKT